MFSLLLNLHPSNCLLEMDCKNFTNMYLLRGTKYFGLGTVTLGKGHMVCIVETSDRIHKTMDNIED